MCPTLGTIWWGTKIPFARYLGKHIFSGVSGKPLCIFKYGEGAITLGVSGERFKRKYEDKQVLMGSTYSYTSVT